MNGSKPIWVLEDDAEVLQIYREILDQRYDYRTFSTLASFEAALSKTPGEAALVVADLRLTDGNFLQFLGKESSAALLMAPFIVISSCDDLDVLRACFEEGALDYLTKPFTAAEFIVKIERYLGLSGGSTALSTSSVVFDPESLSLRGAGNVIAQLTAKELQIFSVLHRSRGKEVSRNALFSEVWRNVSVSMKTLDVHLFNLRKKLSCVGMAIHHVPPNSYVLFVHPDSERD